MKTLTIAAGVIVALSLAGCAAATPASNTIQTVSPIPETSATLMPRANIGGSVGEQAAPSVGGSVGVEGK